MAPNTTSDEIHSILHDEINNEQEETREIIDDKLLIQAADIRKVLTQDKLFSVNFHKVLYNVSSYDISYTASLVDRGANDDISGEDNHVIEKLNRSIDVKGIYNHQIENIAIVIAAGGYQESERWYYYDTSSICICWKNNFHPLFTTNRVLQ